MRRMTTQSGDVLVSFKQVDALRLAGALRRAADVREGAHRASWVESLDAKTMRRLANALDHTGHR